MFRTVILPPPSSFGTADVDFRYCLSFGILIYMDRSLFKIITGQLAMSKLGIQQALRAHRVSH